MVLVLVLVLGMLVPCQASLQPPRAISVATWWETYWSPESVQLVPVVEFVPIAPIIT